MDDVWDLPHEALAALPVFPLANVVLLPGMVLPLNVFEPRYLDLVDALEAGAGYVGVPLIEEPSAAFEDAPAVSDVFGVGRMTFHRRLPDGRRFVRVHGLRRVAAVREHPRTTPYRVFEVRPLPEPPLREPVLREILCTQLERIATTFDDGEREILRSVASVQDPRMLAYAVTAILPALGLSAPGGGVETGPAAGRGIVAVQQRCLAAADTDERFRLLIEHTGWITGILGESGRFPRVMFN